MKKYTKNKEVSRILRVGFAFSKWPHLHKAYSVSGSYSFSVTVTQLGVGIKHVPCSFKSQYAGGF